MYKDKNSNRFIVIIFLKSYNKSYCTIKNYVFLPKFLVFINSVT